MISFFVSNIDIVHRSSPQWVYDYIEPVILILLVFLLLALIFGFCIMAYKDLKDYD